MALKTPTVDASNSSRISKGGKKRYGGGTGASGWINADQRKSLVSEGAGPFPLVLIVHGNHDMAEFSDPGYEYLGELLASRGFILRLQ